MHWEEGFCIQVEGGLHRGGSSSGGGGLYPVESASRGQGVCIWGGGWADPTSEIHGILWDMVNKRAVSILLECILVVIANIRVVITDHKSGTRLRFAS